MSVFIGTQSLKYCLAIFMIQVNGKHYVIAPFLLSLLDSRLFYRELMNIYHCIYHCEEAPQMIIACSPWLYR